MAGKNKTRYEVERICADRWNQTLGQREYQLVWTDRPVYLGTYERHVSEDVPDLFLEYNLSYESHRAKQEYKVYIYYIHLHSPAMTIMKLKLFPDCTSILMKDGKQNTNYFFPGIMN